MGKKKKEFSTILTPDQVDLYKSFGYPDETQNWLEIFTPDMYDDINTIMHCCSDNQLKAEYLEDELKQYGFTVVGEGTNILTMANPYYPGVVYKIALDDFGIADNFNDSVYSTFIPRYNRVFTRDPSALISVQERLVLPTPAQMDLFLPKILGLLKDLSKYFLIADLSPDMRLNYGLTRDGELRFIDASDLYPLSQMKEKPRCKRIVGEHKHTGELKYCEGKLKYTDDFKYFVCEKCGKQFMTLEFRPKKEVEALSKILSDGLNAEARKALELEELQAITGEPKYDIGNPANAVPVPHDDDDDELEPRTIFVSDVEQEDDEIEGSQEELSADTDGDNVDPFEGMERDDEGFISLKPRETSLPMNDVAPEVTESEVSTVEAGIANGPSENDERQASSINGEATVDEDPDKMAFMRLMSHLKTTQGEAEQTLYRGFLKYVTDRELANEKAIREAVIEELTATADVTDEQGDSDTCELACEETIDPIVHLESALKVLMENTNENTFITVCDMMNNYLKQHDACIGTMSDEPLAEETQDEGVYEDARTNLQKVRSALALLDQATENPDNDDFIEVCDMIQEYLIPKGAVLMLNVSKIGVVENENTNISTNGNADQTDPSVPHIHYSVVNADEVDSENDHITVSDKFPGIFLEIYGKFDEAYYESGLSLYLTDHATNTTIQALNARELKELMANAVSDIEYEATHTKLVEALESSENEEEDPDEKDEDTEDEESEE